MSIKGVTHSGTFKAGNKARTNGEITKILMEYKQRKNEFTLALFQRIESIGDALVSKAVDMALTGNERILMLLLDKLINHNLINRLEMTLLSRTVDDIDNSQQLVLEKMGEGTIEASHGLNLLKGLSLKRDTINVKELEVQVNRIIDDKNR